MCLALGAYRSGFISTSNIQVMLANSNVLDLRRWGRCSSFLSAASIFLSLQWLGLGHS